MKTLQVNNASFTASGWSDAVLPRTRERALTPGAMGILRFMGCTHSPVYSSACSPLIAKFFDDRLAFKNEFRFIEVAAGDGTCLQTFEKQLPRCVPRALRLKFSATELPDMPNRKLLDDPKIAEQHVHRYNVVLLVAPNSHGQGDLISMTDDALRFLRPDGLLLFSSGQTAWKRAMGVLLGHGLQVKVIGNRPHNQMVQEIFSSHEDCNEIVLAARDLSALAEIPEPLLFAPTVEERLTCRLMCGWGGLAIPVQPKHLGDLAPVETKQFFEAARRIEEARLCRIQGTGTARYVIKHLDFFGERVTSCSRGQ